MARTLELRGALDDGLHDVVRTGLRDLWGALDAVDRRLPAHVERELERFLVCGDPREGFAWLVCDGCEHHRLVPFSCKGRAFCPACGGRRMAERAARWVDGLFPYLAVRQWVLTVPFRRRWLLARQPELAGGVLRVALGALTRWLRGKSGLARGRPGTVTVIQRLGSALNLHGVFAGRSAWPSVVPKPPRPTPDGAKKNLARAGRVRVSSRHQSWAELLAPEFNVDGWRCPAARSRCACATSSCARPLPPAAGAASPRARRRPEGGTSPGSLRATAGVYPCACARRTAPARGLAPPFLAVRPRAGNRFDSPTAPDARYPGAWRRVHASPPPPRSK